MAKNWWLSGILSTLLTMNAGAQEKPTPETPADKITNLQVNGQIPRLKSREPGSQPTISDIGDCRDYLRNIAEGIRTQTGPYAAYAKRDGSEQTVTADCYNKEAFVQNITFEVKGNEIVLKTSTEPPKTVPRGRGGARSRTAAPAGEAPVPPINE